MQDFTLQKYEELCHGLIENGYKTMTLCSYLSERPSDERVCILRHDVDRKLRNALMMAELEDSIGIRSTYYFRYPYTFNPDIIHNIASLGHEIGYHYETLAKADGDYEKAIQLFGQELEEFRKIADVKTICMHGSPLSKYDNRDLWKRYDFKGFHIIGESYLSIGPNINYFSDTGRCWDRRNKIRDLLNSNQEIPIARSTDDLMYLISQNLINNLYITAHPERWSINCIDWLSGYVKDTIFNIGKKILRGGFRR
jgi:hypothetical protein